VKDLKTTFKNVNSYWETNLFSEVFLNRDLGSHFPEWDSHELDEAFAFAIKYVEDSVDLKNFRSRNEDDTIDIIIELLQLLGWHDGGNLKRDVILKNTCFSENIESEESEIKKKLYKPDLILLDKPGQRRSVNPSLKKYDRDAAEKFCLATLEAKYWGRLKATDAKGKLKIDTAREADRDKLSLQPNQQIQKYMEVLSQEWGILSDGATWRLFNNLDSNGEDVFYEFKLDLWLYDALEFLKNDKKNTAEELRLKESFKYFYFFFRKDSFVRTSRTPTFLKRLQDKTRKYVKALELDLSERFLAAMNTACNGYRESMNAGLAIKSKELIQSASESLLFNILFVRSCETAGILKTDVPPYSKHAIEPIIDSVGAFRPAHGEDNISELTESFRTYLDHEYVYSPDKTDLYEYLLKAFEISKTGMGPYFKGFRESLFSDEEQLFATKYKLRNSCVVRLLFILSYDIKKTYRAEDGRINFQQIAYNTIKPRQLGSIYESFLEFELLLDPSFNRKLKGGDWVKANSGESDTSLEGIMPQTYAPQNTFYFAHSEKSERKATGSYYTPDFIVDYIVSETIDPQIKFTDPESVLNLSVCDPAMGSGHFLASAMRQLANHFEQIYIEKHNEGLELSRREVMTRILEKCIFGVDLNSRAIKLAKMALWLETATPGMHLVNLDKSLLLGNTLYSTFDWERRFKSVFDRGGFDVVIANPPYIGEKYNQHIFEQIRNNPRFAGLHERRSNTYYYFAMLNSMILCPDGISGQIIPIEWESNGSAKKMRGFLADNCEIVNKLRFQKLKVFKSKGKYAGTSSMILVFQNRPPGIATGSQTGLTKITLSGNKLQKMISGENLASSHLKLLGSSNVRRNAKAAKNRFITSTGIKAKDIDAKVVSPSVGVDRRNSNPSSLISESILLESHFHVDQGIVTGADLVTKKNKFIGNNWTKFESQRNLGILILKAGTDITFKGKTGFLNLGNSESKIWRKLNDAELAVLMPLYKNKDIASSGRVGAPTSYVAFFKDEGKKISLSRMPTLKTHLERYKDVLVASKVNCYHNEMLKKIMEPIVNRGNYFVTFYPRPKTNFDREKIVFVCDQDGHSITYSNAPFYASGGNKGGLSFITKLNDDGPSLKLLYAFFLSSQYDEYLSHKDTEAFLSNDTVKKLPIKV
jgi:type I restriction-modification system DNA methylase subunit